MMISNATIMKRSIYLTALILGVGILPAVIQEARLSSLREEHRKLRDEAVSLGIQGVSAESDDGERSTKRLRADLEKHADRVGSSLIGFARELESMQVDGMSADSEFQERAMKVMVELSELDSKQLERVINRLKQEEGISGKSRGEIISYAIMAVADRKPEAAVSLYVATADLLDKSMGSHVITSALGRWAAASPQEAMDWLAENESKHPGVIDEDARRSVLSGVAANDPVLAFDLLDDVGLENRHMAIHAILVTGSNDPQQRTSMLEALRGYLNNMPDLVQREETGAKALELLARSIDHEGFEPLTEWMNASKLSSLEKQQFAGGLTYFTTKEDTGKWVEWMDHNLSPEAVTGPVKDLVSEWTDQDYQAAGKWLGTLTEGPARAAAVEAYAGAVASYDPQVAAQWALTLPPGPAQQATLQAVHENWPTSDPDGAAEFARQHGIE